MLVIKYKKSFIVIDYLEYKSKQQKKNCLKLLTTLKKSLQST